MVLSFDHGPVSVTNGQSLLWFCQNIDHGPPVNVGHGPPVNVGHGPINVSHSPPVNVGRGPVSVGRGSVYADHCL